MLHARTHPQPGRFTCPISKRRYRSNNLADGRQMYEGDWASERAERLDWCCGADLNRYLAGRRGRPTIGWEIVWKGCVIRGRFHRNLSRR